MRGFLVFWVCDVETASTGTDPMTLVLLVGGKLASGKDAFSDHLVENHGFVKLGMSDTLAEALYVLNPWIFASINEETRLPEQKWRYQEFVEHIGYVQAKMNPEVRRLLQVLGTEVGRNLLGENIWVEAAKKKILELATDGKDVVITGIRFPNELALERELNMRTPMSLELAAVSVWIERPSLTRSGDTAVHASESSVGIQDFEYALSNDGTLQKLYGAADELLKDIKGDFSWRPSSWAGLQDLD